jgi:hypothetical protein
MNDSFGDLFEIERKGLIKVGLTNVFVSHGDQVVVAATESIVIEVTRPRNKNKSGENATDHVRWRA